MSSPEAYTDIETRLNGGWTATPLVFENDPFTLPDTPAPFLYVEVFGDDFDQIEIGQQGQNMWEERGIAYLHVMVPNDTGSGEARTLAKQALNLFREQQIGSIRTVKMSIGNGSPGRSFANYWAMTVTLWWARYDFTDLSG